jgi:hypothetical protein
MVMYCHMVSVTANATKSPSINLRNLSILTVESTVLVVPIVIGGVRPSYNSFTNSLRPPRQLSVEYLRTPTLTFHRRLSSARSKC